MENHGGARRVTFKFCVEKEHIQITQYKHLENQN